MITHKTTFLLLVGLGFACFNTYASGQSMPRAGDRARVTIAEVPDTIGGGLPLKVLHTDAGSPLRAGGVWLFKETAANVTANAAAKDPAFYRKMRDARLNAVRLILFEFWFHCDDVTKTTRYSDLDNPTERAALFANIETVLNLASEQGLYVILNPHTKANHGGAVYLQAQHDYVRKFWSYAGPHFKDRTHVIYEQANEVIVLPSETTDAGLDLQQQLYAELRAWAPQTHIALISISGIGSSTGGIDVTKVIADRLSARGTGVDWSNASFWYHLYFNNHTSERMRQIHKYYPAYPGENNFPQEGAILSGVSTTDTVRSESMDVPFSDNSKYVNQTCEQLGTGWALWHIETPYKFDNNWPLARTDAQTKGYYWVADPFINRYAEAEDLAVTATSSGDTHAVSIDAALSGGKGRTFSASAAADFITLRLSAVSPGTYNVKLRVKRGPDRGIVQAAIDPGSGDFINMGAAQDHYVAAPDVVVHDLGAISFSTAGDKLLRLTVTGKNASSTGYSLRLDYVRLTLDITAPTPHPVATLSPVAVEATVALGGASTSAFTVGNTGDAALNYSVQPVFAEYTARDSAQGGPAFNWVDIKTGGTTVLANADDAIVTGIPVGFAFPFYGSTYSTVNICSNGYLSFAGSTVINSTTGETLPSSFVGNPAPMIAPYLLDLVDDASSVITYKQIDAHTFGVLYENVKSFLGSGRITFQVLLKSNGQIVFQYKDNSITFLGTLIGFQDATRTKGQTLVYNEAFLPQSNGVNRALTIFPAASWLSRSPGSGVVAAGAAAQSVTVGFDTTGLVLGSYTSSLILNSDDPDLLSAVIPVTLHVVPPGSGPLWTPTWPRVDAPTSTGFSVRAKTGSDGAAYHVVLAAGAAAPTATQVRSGLSAAGTPGLAAGSIALVANTEASAAVIGLAAATAYDVYVVAADALGNLQADPVKLTITTSALRSLAWDGDGLNASGTPTSAFSVGGSGSWDSTTPRWWDGSAYTPQAADSPDQSIFRGIGGTITLSSDAATRSMSFNQGNLAWILTGGTLRFEAVATFENRVSLSFSQNNLAVSIASPLLIDENALAGTIESVFGTGNASGQTLTLAGGISRAAGAIRNHRLLIAPNTATTGSANVIALTAAITNGGSATGAVFAEFGTRTPTASSGRLELRAVNTYTGDTRIGAGVIVAYDSAPVSSSGIFGASASTVSLGYGQVASAASISLLTHGPVIIARPLLLENGASSNSAYAVTLGGESAHSSLFAGAIDLDGSTPRTTPISLTAASGGEVTFSGALSHNTVGSSVPVNITGGGAVKLDAANAYTGLTTVQSGATLGGAGSVAGGLTVVDGGKLAFALVTNATGHDRFDVGGAVVFSGTSLLTISADSAATTGTYTLLRATGGISGTLPTLMLPSGWTASLAVSGSDLALAVHATTALGSWRYTNFGTSANSGTAADNFDHDGDGSANLLECALGKNPKDPGDRPALDSEVVGDFLEISFLRARADVTYLVEASNDFSSWSALSYEPVPVGQIQTVTDTVNVSTANPPRRALRLRVQSP